MDKATRERLASLALMNGSLGRANDGLVAAFDTALSLTGNKHYSSLVYASLTMVKNMQDGIADTLRSEIPCWTCGGVGSVEDPIIVCPKCNGSGYNLSQLD